MKKQNLKKKQVINLNEIAPNVFILSFKRDFNFIAGQVLAIDLAKDGEPRLYSIESGENEPNIEILFDERPNGKLTPQLSSLKPGDDIYISEPFGNFICNESTAWWIASGTGIAPFVSMIRSGKGINNKLIHGGRSDENFYFSEIISETLSAANYIRCASQQPDTPHYRGRLTSWMREQKLFPSEIKYYLCGSAEMVVEVRDLLISKAIPFQQIISETYY